MQLVNSKNNPTLLATNATPNDVIDVERMINNLLKDSCYENTYRVLKKGDNIYIEKKGT